MDAAPNSLLATALERLDALEARVAQLEGAASEAPRRRARTGVSIDGGSQAPVDASGWTARYDPVSLAPADSWIELHEPSARPHLQRMIREVVDGEGPVTDRLALDRVRRAWGLRRAGGRVQEAFEQAVRQLVARGLVERRGDGLRAPGAQLSVVRIPGEDEASRRAAEDVPLEELALAITRIAQGARGAGVAEDEATMQVAKLLGWTRRGGAIQERLDAALDLAAREGSISRREGRLFDAAPG